MLPKAEYLAKQKVEASWPMHGLPRTLQVDNAMEFHAQTLIRGCRQYGIELVYRPPAHPHFGGHIERLIGTLMARFIYRREPRSGRLPNAEPTTPKKRRR